MYGYGIFRLSLISVVEPTRVPFDNSLVAGMVRCEKPGCKKTAGSEHVYCAKHKPAGTPLFKRSSKKRAVRATKSKTKRQATTKAKRKPTTPMAKVERDDSSSDGNDIAVDVEPILAAVSYFFLFVNIQIVRSCCHSSLTK